MFSRQPACLAGRRSRSPASRSAMPRRWSPNPRSEHDRQAVPRHSGGHPGRRPGGGGGARRIACAADLAPRRVRDQAGPSAREQRHAVAEERVQHQVRGSAHQGPEGRRARPHAGGDHREPGQEPRRVVLPGAVLSDGRRAGRRGLRLHESPGARADLQGRHRPVSPPGVGAGVQRRRANEVYQAEPMGFIYLANLFIGANQTDSAARYFRLAVPAASDPKYAKDKRDAFFNVARVYHAAKRYDEAKAAYKEYLGAYPSDIQAMAALAGLYLRDDKRDSAMALYGAIIGHEDSATAEDLFGAASAVLGGIPNAPDTADMDAACGKAQKKKNPALTVRQIATRCQPAAVDTMSKYHALADPQYRLVSRTYEAGLAKNPYYRDALYNLAGIAYLIGDSSKVLPLAQRLYAVDPLNRLSLAKIAGGWQLLGKKDSVLYYLTLADSLPVEVTVGTFTTNEQGAGVEGLFSNFHSKASQPLKVTFEFVDGKGNVVATVLQDVPVVDAGGNKPFKLKADQPGIVAWRYKRS